MEKIMSQEERIRRAEEIYLRRNQNRSSYTIYKEKNNKEDSEKNVKSKVVRKMCIQMLICIIIYFAFYGLRSYNQLLNDETISKTDEALSYDINLENVQVIFNSGIEKLKGLLKIEDNIEENTIEDESNNEEITENITEEVSEVLPVVDEEIEKISDVLPVGGAEETEEVVEEKSQEEQDIDYVKNNLNIIWPLNGVITSGFGTRTPTEIVTANHYGLDIAGNIGDAIIAAADGTVTLYSTEGDYRTTFTNI